MFRLTIYITTSQRCVLAAQSIRRIACSTVNDFHRTIPRKPTWKENLKKRERTKVEPSTIEHLERMALVNFGSVAGVERLEHAIALAEQLDAVATEGIEPMASVQEDRELYLREDVVTEGYCAEEILINAAKTCEGYFVAPPGNVPLNPQKSSLQNTSPTEDEER